MKRFVFSIIGLGIVATVLYAGVDWIDSSNGDYKCSNGYKGNLITCNKNGTFYVPNACRSEVAKICN